MRIAHSTRVHTRYTYVYKFQRTQTYDASPSGRPCYTSTTLFFFFLCPACILLRASSCVHPPACISCVGLLTLLISIAVLFTSSGALGGLIAGSVLLGAGFVVVTPSAVYLTREPRNDAGSGERNRSESIAIILPAPDFRKHVVHRCV